MEKPIQDDVKKRNQNNDEKLINGTMPDDAVV
jgi:hypothetical protein